MCIPRERLVSRAKDIQKAVRRNDERALQQHRQDIAGGLRIGVLSKRNGRQLVRMTRRRTPGSGAREYDHRYNRLFLPE